MVDLILVITRVLLGIPRGIELLNLDTSVNLISSRLIVLGPSESVGKKAWERKHGVLGFDRAFGSGATRHHSAHFWSRRLPPECQTLPYGALCSGYGYGYCSLSFCYPQTNRIPGVSNITPSIERKHCLCGTRPVLHLFLLVYVGCYAFLSAAPQNVCDLEVLWQLCFWLWFPNLELSHSLVLTLPST